MQTAYRVPSVVVLADLDGFFAANLRRGTTVQRFGPLALYLRAAEGRCTVHPVPGAGEPAPHEVRAALDRQRELGVPEKILWIAERLPGLRAVAEEHGLTVTAVPQMVHTGPVPAVPDTVRLLGPDEVDVLRTARSPAPNPAAVDRWAGEVARGERLTAVAPASGPMRAIGDAQRVGAVAEIVGVATEPVARGRGLASAVTAALLAAATEAGVHTVFLSASDDRVARLYARLGFATVGTFCLARRGDGPYT